jgi:hypothetical protein
MSIEVAQILDELKFSLNSGIKFLEIYNSLLRPSALLSIIVCQLFVISKFLSDIYSGSSLEQEINRNKAKLINIILNKVDVFILIFLIKHCVNLLNIFVKFKRINKIMNYRFYTIN